MSAAGAKIRKRHLVSAADLGVQMMDLTGETVGGQPLDHGLGIEKRPIDFFRRCAQYAMNLDGVWHGVPFGSMVARVQRLA
jgi:hypothetical protein